MSEPHPVTIEGHAYHPQKLTIKVGECVQWTNKDPVKHNAFRDQAPVFNTGLLKQNQTSAPVCVFTKASGPEGFEYSCTPHPHMKGYIVVEP